jgi:hypothetical protein
MAVTHRLLLENQERQWPVQTSMNFLKILTRSGDAGTDISKLPEMIKLIGFFKMDFFFPAFNATCCYLDI